VSAFREVALEHANRGEPVFPLKPDGATPLLPGTWPENARDEAVLVRHWWAEHPDAGIAVVTGKRSGLLVVAVRGEAGATSLNALGEMPATRVTSWGRDLLFWLSLPRQASKIAQTLPEGRVRLSPRRDLAASIVPSSTDWLGLGLRVVAEGGWVAMPPTNGCRVVVDVEPAPAPAWLLLEASPSSFPPPEAA